MGGVYGFPKKYWFGQHEDSYALVMEYLEKSLDHYLRQEKTFSLKTAIVLVLQTIDRLEAMHSKFYIHRDLKPANLMMGLDQ
jgi:serine/threonine protein kinase